MRKVLPMLAVVLFVSASLLVRGAEGKKVTVEGEAQCAKCSLGEGTSCQNVVIEKKDGKETKYYVEMNELAKKAHKEMGFCSAKKNDGPKVKVVGICEKKDGKLVIIPEAIEKL